MTSRSSKQLWKLSNVFFIVLTATWLVSRAVSKASTNHCSAPRNGSTGGPDAGQRHAPKAAIANFPDHFVLVFEAGSRHGSALCPGTMGGFVENGHGDGEGEVLRLL
jgi:hypothetical protein